jgi:hypothetical protein
MISGATSCTPLVAVGYSYGRSNMRSTTTGEEDIPPSESLVVSTIELSEEVIARVDDWGSERQLTRSEALSRLVESGLKGDLGRTRRVRHAARR